MIENPHPAVLYLARKFMLGYIRAVGPCQPSDFDRDITGQDAGDAFAAVFERRGPDFNRTIFCNAMAELVGEGLVVAENKQDGWWYTLAAGDAPALAYAATDGPIGIPGPGSHGEATPAEGPR